MRSIAMINGSKKYDGMQIASLVYRDVLDELGYKTTWYQCTDGGKLSDYNTNGKLIKGLNLGSQTLSIGVNRLFVFHKEIGKLKEDIVFLTDPTLIKIAENNNNAVIKIHDLIPLTAFRPKISGYFMFKYLMPKLSMAERLIVTTNHMKEQMIELNLPEDKIYVVNEPTSFIRKESHISESIDRIENGKEVNVLYVASDKPYKNINYYLMLAKRFSLFDERKRFKFNLVSKIKNKTKKFLKEFDINNVQVYSDVDDIGTIYEKSDILLYPSLYEGFGRPLIEAMFYGIPIIANEIQPFLEIVGNSGLYADVSDIDGWIHSLLSLSKPENYEKYAKMSYEQSRNFAMDRFKNSLEDAFKGM